MDRFSMLPGGGLYRRYRWWRFRRAVAAFGRSMAQFADACDEAARSIESFANHPAVRAALGSSDGPEAE